ncbi:MAG: Ig-like domain-containing protein [Pseudomonadota bacterium]
MTIIAESGAIWNRGFFTRPPSAGQGPLNLPPVTTDDNATVEAGGSMILDVLANDFDPEGETLSLLSASADQGFVVINPDATLSYTAPTDFSGTATITYLVSDPGNRTSAGSAEVLITAQTVPLPIVSVSEAPSIVSASSALLQFTSSEAGPYLVSGSGILTSGTADVGTSTVLLTGLADDTVYNDVQITVTNSAGTSLPTTVPSFTLIILDIEIGGLGEVNFITRFDDQTLVLDIAGQGAPYDGTYSIEPNDFLAMQSGPINLIPPSITQSDGTLILVPALNLQREDGGAISEEIEW